MAIIGHKEEFGDPRLSKIAETDTKKWYQKPNLRILYLILVPCGLGVEWTSGFDSSMMNSLQAVQSWVDCRCPSSPLGSALKEDEKTHRRQPQTLTTRRRAGWASSRPSTRWGR